MSRRTVAAMRKVKTEKTRSPMREGGAMRGPATDVLVVTVLILTADLRRFYADFEGYECGDFSAAEQ
jgi:hypothetical protein